MKTLQLFIAVAFLLVSTGTVFAHTTMGHTPSVVHPNQVISQFRPAKHIICQ